MSIIAITIVVIAILYHVVITELGNQIISLDYGARELRDIIRSTPLSHRASTIIYIYKDDSDSSGHTNGLTNLWSMIKYYSFAFAMKYQLMISSRDIVLLTIYKVPSSSGDSSNSNNSDKEDEAKSNSDKYNQWYEWQQEYDDIATIFHVKDYPSFIFLSKNVEIDKPFHSSMFAGIEQSEALIYKNLSIWNEGNNHGHKRWTEWTNTLIKSEIRDMKNNMDWTSSKIQTRDQWEVKTYQRISVMAPKLPRFSQHGWAKMKIPSTMLKELQQYRKRMEKHRAVEGWYEYATEVNTWDVNMTLVSLDLDPRFRNRVAGDYLKPIIEDHFGVKGLSMTAFYGIREYYNGSFLKMHVDRTSTHVLSAILNIDQEEVIEPWKLQVIDFNGKRLDIIMEPGDLVLYESATLPHGRPEPFKGKRYTNAFCHFSPPDW